ncbi:MAG: ParB N-terminal domain-containing protein [SAR324 cluster bacterium]|nr:ParB N-terminal domain-containing protein [SAR324 cluster bacterium]
MKWSCQEVLLNRINAQNSPFDWSLVKTDIDLRQSLKSHGLLMPFVIQSADSSQFLLIDGFKRIKALRELEHNAELSFPCLVVPSEISSARIALWRLETQSKQQSFKGPEVCRILTILAELGFEESAITEQVLPKLGMKPSKKTTEELLLLGQLLRKDDSELLMHCTADEMLPLLKFSDAEIPILFRNLKDLKLGGNKWKSLLQLLNEVCRFRNWTLAQIMDSAEVVRILHDPQIQSPVRFRLLKQKLETWRYPELTSSRERFETDLKSLRLPKQVEVQYDPFFEKDNLLLKFKAGSLKELTEQVFTVKEKLKMETWESLFQLIHGEEF